MFSDAHTHLDQHSPEELPRVLSEARALGVNLIVAASSDLPSARRAIDFSHKYPGVYAAVGLHPWKAVPINEKLYRQLKEVASQKGVAALSEVGLDFQTNMFTVQDISGDKAVHETQKKALASQLRLARELGLPVVLHCRGAHKEMMAILKRERASEVGGAIHGFGGDAAMLQDWLGLGFYICVGFRAVTAPDFPQRAEVYQKIPLDRLLFETDSDPRRAPEAARALAPVLGKSPEEIGKAATANLKRLLKLKE